MSNGKILILLFVLFLGLWVAYKIGKVILRVLCGLLVLALVAFAIYRFILR